MGMHYSRHPETSYFVKLGKAATPCLMVVRPSTRPVYIFLPCLFFKEAAGSMAKLSPLYSIPVSQSTS